MEKELKELPLMLGTDWVCHCLGISRAKLHRALQDGRMRPAVKIGCTNHWKKDYIQQVMENGFEPPGTYEPAPRLPAVLIKKAKKKEEEPVD